MLQEPGRVTAIEPNHVWVETRAQIGCERCASGRGCGSATLAQFFGSAGRPDVKVKLPSDPEFTAAVGDTVLVGLDERAVVSGSLALYAMPLIVMLVAAIAASAISQNELITIISAAAGFASGLLGTRYFVRNIANNQQYEPVVVRKLPATAWLTSGNECPSKQSA